MGPPSQAGSAFAWQSHLALAATVVVLSAFVLGAGMPRLLATVPDDAAYYFKIAENASAGKGFTFDGINQTNGFQPLWLAVLVPLYAAYRGEPETMFRIFLMVQLVFLAAATLLTQALLGRFHPPHIVLLGVLIFLFSAFIPAVNGMESALLVFLFALLFFAGVAWGIGVRRGAGRHALFGVLSGLVMLARLDTVFFLLVVGSALLGKTVARGEGGRRGAGGTPFFPEAVCVVAGAAAIVAPYLVWNLMSFGGLVPISGMLKSSFPSISHSGGMLGRPGKGALGGLALSVCYLIWFLARYGALRRDGSRRLFYWTGVALAAGGVLLHFLHTILFMKWAVFRWHFIPYAFVGSLIACEPLERLIPALRTRGARAFYFLVLAAILGRGLFGLVGASRKPLEKVWSTAAYDAALWARRETPVGAVFAMKDAGNFGYFSERSTINLDGVVNSRAYQDVLRDKAFGGYLAQCGVRYLVQHAFWNRPDILNGAYEEYRIGYWSHLHGTGSDEIAVRRADEVYRSRPYFDGPYETVFIIWRLRGSQEGGSGG